MKNYLFNIPPIENFQDSINYILNEENTDDLSEGYSISTIREQIYSLSRENFITTNFLKNLESIIFNKDQFNFTYKYAIIEMLRNLYEFEWRYFIDYKNKERKQNNKLRRIQISKGKEEPLDIIEYNDNTYRFLFRDEFQAYLTKKYNKPLEILTAGWCEEGVLEDERDGNILKELNKK